MISRYVLTVRPSEEGTPVFVTHPAMGSSQRGDALLFTVVGESCGLVKRMIGALVSQTVYSCAMQQLASYPSVDFCLKDLREEIIGMNYLKELNYTAEEVALLGCFTKC